MLYDSMTKTRAAIGQLNSVRPTPHRAKGRHVRTSGPMEEPWSTEDGGQSKRPLGLLGDGAHFKYAGLDGTGLNGMLMYI